MRLVNFDLHWGLLLHARQDVGLLAQLLGQQSGQVVVTAAMIIAVLVWHVASLADHLGCVMRFDRRFCGDQGEFGGGLLDIPALCVIDVDARVYVDTLDGGHISHAPTSFVLNFKRGLVHSSLISAFKLHHCDALRVHCLCWLCNLHLFMPILTITTILIFIYIL